MRSSTYTASADAMASVFAVLVCFAQLFALTEGKLSEQRKVWYVNDRDVHAGVREALQGEVADVPFTGKQPAAQHLQGAVESSGSRSMKRLRSRPGSVPGRLFAFGLSAEPRGRVPKLAAAASMAVIAATLSLLGTVFRLCFAKAGPMSAEAGSRPRWLAPLRPGLADFCEILYEPVGKKEGVNLGLPLPVWGTSGHRAGIYRLLGVGALVAATAAVLTALAVYFTRPAASAEDGNSKAAHDSPVSPGSAPTPSASSGLAPSPSPSPASAPDLSASPGPAPGHPVSSGSAPSRPVSPGSAPSSSMSSAPAPSSSATSGSARHPPETPDSATGPADSPASVPSPSVSSDTTSNPSVSSHSVSSGLSPRTSTPRKTAKGVQFPDATVHCWPLVCEIDLKPGAGGTKTLNSAQLNGVTYYILIDPLSLALLKANKRNMDSLTLQWAEQVQSARLAEAFPLGTTIKMGFAGVPLPEARFPDASVRCWQTECEVELEPGLEGKKVVHLDYLGGVTYSFFIGPRSLAALRATRKNIDRLVRKWARQVERARGGMTRFPGDAVSYTMDFDLI